MPLDKNQMRDYMRRQRLRARLCEGCGGQPATVHFQAGTHLRSLALCQDCESCLRGRRDRVKVRLTHIDGSLPNVALMKLAHYHKSRGDFVWLARTPTRQPGEPEYDLVYASTIFSWSGPVIDRLLEALPGSVVGGTGSGNIQTVESLIGSEYEFYDYGVYPEYPYSLGFTQRGCRLSCKFCVVPQKEGKPRSVNSIYDIWRPDTPRAVLLLDNDFFGGPEWRDRAQELREGEFKVAFSQGINIRTIDDEAATTLATLNYRDNEFKKPRIYTAWDNLGDEARFFEGLARLNEAGIPSKHVMVYMLVGYKPGETMEEVMYRFGKLRDSGCMPFPMVYERWRQPELRKFARWVIRRYYQFIPWEDFK